jgi:hypothetical protein
MAKLIVAALVVGLGLASPGWAQSKDCGELKGEIEAKIKKNGVEKFTLDVVEKDAQADGRSLALATVARRRSSINAVDA